MANRIILLLILGLVPALLVACGDTFVWEDDDTYGEDDDAGDDDTADDDVGDDDDDSGPNSPPEAVAGDTIFIDLGDTAQLDGSDSSDPDGDTLEFFWVLAQEPTGNTATLVGAATDFPEITPNVTGVYKIELTVTDPGGLDDTADVSVWVAQGNEPPIANAGNDQNATQGDTVQLDGGASYDPNGDSLEFYWTVTSAPGNTPTLSDATSVVPTFVAADIGLYQLELVVNDGQYSSDPDQVVINSAEDSGSGDCLNCAAYMPPNTNPQPLELSVSPSPVGRPARTGLIVLGLLAVVATLLQRRRKD